MILVADSGSTKTDWILQIQPDGAENLQFSTPGINAFYITDKDIARLFLMDDTIRRYADKVSEVYFFGEGCSNPDKREMVSNGLTLIFKNAFISVENDTVGSAYATCGDDQGYTSVLGTGSNIAFFDGQQVHYSHNGLGFVLGDEGSGTWYGKKLLTSYLYGKMPSHLRKRFQAQYGVTKNNIIQNVYQRPLPHLYLASFAPFLSTNRGSRFIEELLAEGFETFISSHVLPLPDYQQHPCHFVGSIAWYFRDVLQNTCQRHGVQAGKILSHPIKELSQYIFHKALHS